MALQLIYGNSGSGKSTYIYEKVIQMAQADRRRNFYVIVPEQFTMQAQRELVQRSQNHVIVNIDVVSFDVWRTVFLMNLAFRIQLWKRQEKAWCCVKLQKKRERI